MFPVVRCVIMITIFMMDIMTRSRTILIMTIRVILIHVVTLMCMVLLSRMIMSCIMIVYDVL